MNEENQELAPADALACDEPAMDESIDELISNDYLYLPEPAEACA
jgi:hypothetical protein